MLPTIPPEPIARTAREWLGPSADHEGQALLEHAALDEREFDAKRRAEVEARDARLRAKLSHAKHTRAVYLSLANRSTLLYGQHARFRVLFTLAELASTDLSNCFPARRTAARMLGMSVATYNSHLVRLRRDGWLRTHETRREDGRAGSSDVQFCLPRGVLPLGDAWEGPCDWSNRAASVRRKGR